MHFFDCSNGVGVNPLQHSTQSDGKFRQFHLFLPENLNTPRPLFVSLTGTVATELEFVSNEVAQFESLVNGGWIVVAPL